jgi:Co/Zn/Cd efflux system component
LWVNLTMFLAESTAGLLAHSTALLADSIDMLGMRLSTASVSTSSRAGRYGKGAVPWLKGVIMAAFGAGVLTEVAVKLIAGVVPVAETIGVIGVLALIANAVCLALLWRRRTDDVNMRSAWTCSLDDVAGNVGVLVAVAGVALTGRAWPDIVVGLGIAALFVTSAVGVIRDARGHLRAVPAA